MSDPNRKGTVEDSRPREASAKTVLTSILESHWFYASAALAVICGPTLIPGVGIKEWFLILVGGGVALYLAIVLNGTVLEALRDRRRGGQRARRR